MVARQPLATGPSEMSFQVAVDDLGPSQILFVVKPNNVPPGRIMEYSLVMSSFSKLSPQAKKAAMMGNSEGPVVALVELAPGFEPETLDLRPASLGGTVRSWNAQSRIMTLSIDPSRLQDLSNTRGVNYVQVGTGMRGSPEQRR